MRQSQSWHQYRTNMKILLDHYWKPLLPKAYESVYTQIYTHQKEKEIKPPNDRDKRMKATFKWVVREGEKNGKCDLQ